MRSPPGVTGPRRLNPRPWDYSYYELRLLRRTIEAHLSSEHLRPAESLVVDLGCGTRPYEPLVTNLGAKYLGYDLVGTLDADGTISSDGTVDTASDSADVVLSTQVIAHARDYQRHIAESYRILKPGGLLLLSTHFLWLYTPHPTDFRRWTSAGLKHDLELFGYEVESVTGCVGPLAYTTQLRLQLFRGFCYSISHWLSPLLAVVSTVAQWLMMLEDKVTPRATREKNSSVYVAAARKPIRAALK